MSDAPLSVAFLPLVDAAPLIVAAEMGFDREEGLRLELRRATSWAMVRDMLALGRVEAAHMLSPMPVAMALGIGGITSSISALMVLSMNGTVLGVSTALAERLKDPRPDFGDARAMGAAFAALEGPRLRIGVPFPFSMHAELLYHWLSASGLPAPQSVDVRTVPPPLMADALESGDIDAFCVGEPWGSLIVDRGIGELILPGQAIWSAAPEKVLAVRTGWAEEEPALCGRLMRAVWRAGRWLAEGGAKTTAAELLAQPAYLDLPVEMIDRSLTGRLVVAADGSLRVVEGFLRFHQGATSFPWRSQGAWIAGQMAARLGLDRQAAQDKGRAVFRSDLYRRHLKAVGATLPGASEKIEGGLPEETAVTSEQGRLILPRNAFFDGSVFDPNLGS